MGLRDIFTRDLYITQEIRDRYKQIEQRPLFRDKDLKHIFMLCLALGYDNGKGKRTPMNGKTIGLLKVSSFRDEDLWAIAAIAITENEGDLKTLEDGSEIKKIAAEYANTGLPKLERMIHEYGADYDFATEMEKIGFDAMKKLKID